MNETPEEPRSFKRWFGTLLPYLIAGVLYIAIGVWQPRFLLSWSEGIIFLLLIVWWIPEYWRRHR
jgi:hypothetical protein